MTLPKGWREIPYPENLKEYTTKKCFINNKKKLSIVLTEMEEEKVKIRHLSIASSDGTKVRQGDVNLMKKYFARGQLITNYGNRVVPSDALDIKHVLYRYQE